MCEGDTESEPNTDDTVGDDLAELGYRRTESECHQEECEGVLWYDDNTLVCNVCSYAIDLDQRRRRVALDDPWDQYRDSPPRYDNSNYVRLPGGFLSPYDWVSSDDLDGNVSDVEPDAFYR